MRQDQREKAIQILAPFAKHIEIEDEEYYIVTGAKIDADEYEEDPYSESFCSKCIVLAIEKYTQKHKEELEKKGHVVYHKSLSTTGTEFSGFKQCDMCHTYFNTCLFLNDQELRHWESLNGDLKSKDPDVAYQLSKIFANDNRDTNRVNVLAEQVIAEHTIVKT